MSSLKAIREHEVPPGHVALWWLGQLGYILKSPGGQVVAIDPYLTNSCAEGARRAGLNVDRLVPPPIQPGEMDVDVIAFTHSHGDHCDAETILEHRRAGRTARYLAPGETMEKLVGLGIAQDDITLTWPNREHRFGDMRLKSTFAIPFWGDDLTHSGYLVFIDNGPTVYITGDTDYHDVLGYIADYKPDVMITVINGTFRNLGPNEAVKLTMKINPKIVIPCHYDLFPDNSLDPRIFRAFLHAAGLSDKYVLLEHGKPFTYPEQRGALSEQGVRSGVAEQRG
jgi:L-ascorbate 6-phosphate lactonase